MRGWLLAILLAVPSQDPPGPVKELYESGKVKAQYSLDKDGKKDGQYQEFHENGKRRIVAVYAHGVLDRAYEEYHENGKPKVKKRYARGRIDGELLRFDDKGAVLHRVLHRKDGVLLYPDFTAPVPAHPRSTEAIRKKLDEIDPPTLHKDGTLEDRWIEAPALKAPHKPGKLKKEYLESALRHVRAYRYLSDVPHDVGMHEPFNELCQHGAVVMAVNGNLSHTPPQPPGMAKDFYDRGYEACSKSNISMSPGWSLRGSVDRFMNDSDARNIDDVGHRAWLLSPKLGKVGFGEAGDKGTFKALWVVDFGGEGAKGKEKPVKPGPKSPPLIAYPAPGYYPSDYLDPDAAWCVAPQGGDFQMPTKGDLRVEVWKLNDEYDLEQKLELNYVNVADKILGKFAIFRPVFPKGELAGQRFLVTLSGKGPGRIAYLVEFFKRIAG